MTITNDEVISTLNNLIEICKDGQDGFKAAAEGVEAPETKNLFYHYSQQRAQFAGELQEQVRHLGGDPEQSGSMAGAVHRGWINLKAALTGKDQHAVLTECENGEDSAVSNYQAALQKELPVDVKQLVSQQADTIKQAHDRVRSLRDLVKAAKA